MKHKIKILRNIFIFGIISWLFLFSLATPTLAGKTISPIKPTCQENQFFDENGVEISGKFVSRMSDFSVLIEDDLKEKFGEDLKCQGYRIVTSFNLVLQRKLAQKFLEFSGLHKEVDNLALLVCDPSKKVVKGAILTNGNNSNWVGEKISLENENQSQKFSFLEIAKYGCGDTQTVALITNKDGKLYFENVFKSELPKNSYKNIVIGDISNNNTVTVSKTNTEDIIIGKITFVKGTTKELARETSGKLISEFNEPKEGGEIQ